MNVVEFGASFGGSVAATWGACNLARRWLLKLRDRDYPDYRIVHRPDEDLPYDVEMRKGGKWHIIDGKCTEAEAERLCSQHAQGLVVPATAESNAGIVLSEWKKNIGVLPSAGYREMPLIKA